MMARGYFGRTLLHARENFTPRRLRGKKNAEADFVPLSSCAAFSYLVDFTCTYAFPPGVRLQFVGT